MSNRVIDILDNLLNKERQEIVEMTIWLCSNILHENEDEKNKIIGSKLFKTITTLIETRKKDIKIVRMISEFFKNLLHKKNYDKITENCVISFLI